MKRFLLNHVLLMSAATEGSPAPAADAAPAPAAETKPAKPKQPSQNDVTRPTPGTKTGDVWDIADRISATQKRPALREEVMSEGHNAGINKGTIATQYARWTQFHGVSKEARSAARTAMKPAPVAAAPADAAAPAPAPATE